MNFGVLNVVEPVPGTAHNEIQIACETQNMTFIDRRTRSERAVVVEICNRGGAFRTDVDAVECASARSRLPPRRARALTPPRPQVGAAEARRHPVARRRGGQARLDGGESERDRGRVGAIDKEAGARVANEKKWRGKCGKHVVSLVELSASPDAALSAANAGLKYLHETFTFVRDGEEMSIAPRWASSRARSRRGASSARARARRRSSRCRTRARRCAATRWYVPISLSLSRARRRAGAARRHARQAPRATPRRRNSRKRARNFLKNCFPTRVQLAQIDKWVRDGVIEMTCGHAMAQVVRNPQWLDLSDKWFCLLGAGSAMGPLLVLLAAGANIVAVDLNRAPIWERLITLARASAGTMVFPLSKPEAELKGDDAALFAAAGSNLFTQTPEIRNWLLKVLAERLRALTATATALLRRT